VAKVGLPKRGGEKSEGETPSCNGIIPGNDKRAGLKTGKKALMGVSGHLSGIHKAPCRIVLWDQVCHDFTEPSEKRLRRVGGSEGGGQSYLQLGEFYSLSVGGNNWGHTLQKEGTRGDTSTRELPGEREKSKAVVEKSWALSCPENVSVSVRGGPVPWKGEPRPDERIPG